MPQTLPHFFSHNLYELGISQRKEKTYLYMQFRTPFVTTFKNHDILYILKKQLPSIFLSTCYNDFNLPFRKEVENTELGHLYEHILLEYLAVLYRAKCTTLRDFEGLTSWNWKKNPRGSFVIQINVGKNDQQILSEAIALTNGLMISILEPLIPTTSHSTFQLKIEERNENDFCS